LHSFFYFGAFGLILRESGALQWVFGSQGLMQDAVTGLKLVFQSLINFIKCQGG